MSKKYFGTDGIRGTVGEGPINPEFMLKLGWAVVRDMQGIPLRNINSINTGQMVKISMDKGSLTAVVKEKTND